MSINRSLAHTRRAAGSPIVRATAEALEARQLLATIAVNNAGDAGGVGTAANRSLRQAINAANADATADTIIFNLPPPAPGGFTAIRPTTTLPTITQPVLIDATSVSTAVTSGIRIRGDLAGELSNGLVIDASNVTIRKLDVQDFGQSGIVIRGGTGNRIEGCGIGSTGAGQTSLGNGLDGIQILTAGNTVSRRNVIGGNARHGILVRGDFAAGTGNVIVNNRIGVSAFGAGDANPVDIGNGMHGISLEASGNRVGAVSAAQGDGTGRNVISGNGGDGVHIERTIDVVIGRPGRGGGTAGGDGGTAGGDGGSDFGPPADDNVVAGNFIGTDVIGLLAVPNGLNGVQIINGSRNQIGAADAVGRNVISGNARRGVTVNAVSAESFFGGVLTGISQANAVVGNYVGLDAVGRALGNGRSGVAFEETQNAYAAFTISNRVGGTAPGERNVIGANAGPGVSLAALSGGTVVAGNYIGTDPFGVAARPNGEAGVFINDSGVNTVGGTSAAARNLISGNAHDGVLILSTNFAPDAGSDNLVLSNYIGTDAAGQRAIGNGRYGVRIVAGSDNQIGDSTIDGSQGNLISGNGAGGVGIGYNTAEFVENGFTADNQIQNNLIGTNALGTAAIPNNGYGVAVREFDSNNPTTGTLVGGSSVNPQLRGGNTISGNASGGILLNGQISGTQVLNNRVGVGPGGVLGTFGNNGIGVSLARVTGPVAIGGTAAAGGGNTIVGSNGDGIRIGFDTTDGTNNVTISANNIGTDAAGLRDLENLGAGIRVTGSTAAVDRNITIGSNTSTPGGNRIAFNRVDGVAVQAGLGVEIARNRIYRNGEKFPGNTGLSIDLNDDGVTPNDNGDADAGPNALLNFPVFTAATRSGTDLTVAANIASAANTTFRVDFYGLLEQDASGFGEGDVYLGSANATTSATGTVAVGTTLSIASTPTIRAVSATITRTSDGSTSEFSPARTIANSDLIVTNSNDSGAGSLRQAIFDANANPDTNLIRFAIPSAAAYVITPLTALPDVAFPILLDATTQPGYAGTPIVQLVGTGAGVLANGLVIRGGNSTVRGLVIRDFAQSGVQLRDLDANVVAGNYIGTDLTGTLDRGNNNGGVFIFNGSDDNLIGGAGQGNVISGNGSGVVIAGATGTGGTARNVVRANLIGTNAAGTAAVPNSGAGVTIDASAGNVIGGSAPGTGNLISGNGDRGVFVQSAGSTGNRITRNLIGTNGANTGPLGNGRFGIWFNDSGGDNVVGGDQPDTDGNVIAFNGEDGVIVSLSNTAREQISGNAIYANGGLGIDLGPDGVTPNDPLDADAGANGLQNFPVLTAAVPGANNTVAVGGYVQTVPNSYVVVEVFLSDAADPSAHGEGQRYLGRTLVFTDGFGRATFGLSAAAPAGTPAGQFATATARVLGPSPQGTSEFSLARVVSADAALPSAAPSADSFETDPVYRVTFTEDVSQSLTADDLVLINQTTGERVSPADYDVAYDPETNTAAFRFPRFFGSVPIDAEYVVTIDPDAVNDVAGNPLDAPYADAITLLTGDVNRDGAVNFADLVILAQNYNQTGRTYSQGNLDYSSDGLVGFADLVILAQNYNAALPTAALPAASGRGADAGPRENRDDLAELA